MLWQLCPLLLCGSSPWTDQCLLISLLSALSKQPCQNNCHRDWERGVFRGSKPPYFGEFTPYLGRSFIKPPDFLFLEWRIPSRATLHRVRWATCGINESNCKYFLIFPKLYHCSAWPPCETKAQQGSVKLKANGNYAVFVKSQKGCLWNLNDRFYWSWTNTSEKSLINVHAKNILFSCS